MKDLRSQFEGKKVLLIAPGKSILGARDEIQKLVDDSEICTISLNNFEFATDLYSDHESRGI